ncbi:MAG TPA: hypothetical protein PLD27_06365 [bacterium]|nr:hypothetical protein [bacterium]HOL47520.1 hypothetical protein [bacterium]HPQ18826.1 hypothetical protein [bacterium]
MNNENFFNFLFVIFIPFIFLFLTKYFYYSIKFPIREFRVELKAVKYLYLLVFTAFIFLKVIYLFFLLKKNNIIEYKKILVFLFAFYIFINFSIIEYFQYCRGDEIEYYLVLNSLINDFDFNIVNDVLYREFICNTNILPVISIDKPNLLLTQHCSSVLIYIVFFIPYLIAKRFGVLLFLNFLFSFGFLLLFDYFKEYIKKRYLLFLIILLPGFTIYSTKFYPEIFPVFYLIFFFLILKKINKRFFFLSIFLNSLLLFNIRFLIVSFASTIILSLKIKEIKNKILFFLGFFIPLFIFLFLNYLIYGSFSIAANTGGKEISFFKLNNFYTLNALLFDQEFGVIIYNPILIFFICCFYLSKKLNNYIIILIIIFVYLFFLSFYADNWWGGISPPFRFSLFIIILLYPLFFYLYENIEKYFVLKILFILFLILTLLNSYLLISFPVFQYNERLNGKNQIIEKIDWLSGINITSFFPSYIRKYNIEMQYIFWIIIILINLLFFRYILNYSKK